MKPWCAEDFMAGLLARSGVTTASQEPAPAKAAKAAKAANREHPCGPVADSVICEDLRKLRNDDGEGEEEAGGFAEFAELRKPENQSQSEQPCGFSQDSQDSQGVNHAEAIAAATDHHHVDAARTCADCQHFGPRGTYFEPVAAGLRTEQEGFGIAWPDEGQATTCTVFSAKAPQLTQERPYKLTLKQLYAAHAEPWSEAVIVRFQARTAAIQRHGYGEQDAEDLAEQLHLRDVHSDYRHLCVECSHYRPGRCGNYGAAGLATNIVGRELATMFQNCSGFGEVLS